MDRSRLQRTGLKQKTETNLLDKIYFQNILTVYFITEALLNDRITILEVLKT